MRKDRYMIFKIIKEANEIVELMNDCDEDSYNVLNETLSYVLDGLLNIRSIAFSLHISKRGFYYVRFYE